METEGNKRWKKRKGQTGKKVSTQERSEERKERQDKAMKGHIKQRPQETMGRWT